MVWVRASKGKLGHIFSEAKFKMQIPAERLKFDLVNSLGLRACSQTLWSLSRASPQPPDWPPLHTSPAWRLLALNLGAEKRESSQDTGCQHVGKFNHRAPYLQGFLLSGLPSRTPDGTVTQCLLGLWQFYFRCNLLNTENRRPEYLLWATLLLSPYTVWCKCCS